MSELKKQTVEDGIMNSGLSENMQKYMLDFIVFLKDNEFSVETETGDDGIGWKIVYMNECVGHMNFADVGIWIDTCDFGGSGSADDALKEATWAHVRVCEHFSSGGKRCGCGSQPGFSKTIFGKKFENLCFALLEFVNPDAKTIEDIKKLMSLFKQNRLKKVSEAAMRFLRGKYMLDEVSSGPDEVSFRDGEQTILTIYIRDGHYDFQIGESMVRVSGMESLEEAKRLVLARKEPNRTPFPKEAALQSRCGMRCDLCVHYAGGTISKEFKRELQERIARVYGGDNLAEWDSCPGCGEQEAGKVHPCMGGGSCWELKCAAEKGHARCQDCNEYDNDCRPWVGYARGIEARSISAEDVTWAILPFVGDQYGN